jgi:hypothetical protein
MARIRKSRRHETMNDVLRESGIVRAVAEKAARRITRKAIADLEQLKDTLSGDDSGLQTAWDEICVQVQGQESFYWDIYDESVRSIVAGCIPKLAKYEREAIWLQTDAGNDWDFEEPEEREPYPITR